MIEGGVSQMAFCSMPLQSLGLPKVIVAQLKRAMRGHQLKLLQLRIIEVAGDSAGGQRQLELL